MTLADLAGDRRGQSLVRGTPHVLQRFANAALGKEIQIWRLGELDRQRVAQRRVEDRISSPIVEISEKDRVLLRERRRFPRPQQGRYDGHHDNERGNGKCAGRL